MLKYCKWCSAEFDAPGDHWYVSKVGYFTCKLRQHHHYDKDREKVCKRANARYLRVKDDPTWKQRTAEQNRQYYQENREHVMQRNCRYYRNRLKTDIAFKLRVRIGTRLSDLIRKGKGRKSSRELTGCTWEELRAHIESQFYPNPKTGEQMTWDNYGVYGWHIDHRKPFAAIDISDPNQLKSVTHYSNLQPLWWFENLTKHAKILENVDGKA